MFIPFFHAAEYFRNIILHCLGGVDYLLFPPYCIICQTSICHSDEGLCPNCWQQLAQNVAADYCRRCGRSISPFGIINGRCGACQDEEFAFDGIVRAGVYETALRNLILAFKFHRHTEYAARISRMMADALAVSGVAGKIDYFVPVPLHWRRRLERGYNQALYLSRGLSAGPARISAELVRTRYTRRQWTLTDTQRRTNVKNAFAVRRGHRFAGKTVCLVDDITTSGATLNECAKVLKLAGARNVYALVAAVAHSDQ
jgi:ComF family protein